MKPTNANRFRTPEKLGEKVLVVDESSCWYNKIGHKQAVRIEDNEVLLFFPENKSFGHLVPIIWNKCRRVD